MQNADPESSAQEELAARHSQPDSWQDYAQSLGYVAAATLIAALLRPHLAATNLAMVYLLAVVIVAARCSRAIAVLTSFLSVAAFDFFCVDRKSTRLNSSHVALSRMPSSA